MEGKIGEVGPQGIKGESGVMGPQGSPGKRGMTGPGRRLFQYEFYFKLFYEDSFNEWN